VRRVSRWCAAGTWCLALVVAASAAPGPAGGAEGPAAGTTAPAVRLPGYGPRVFGDHPSVAQMTDLGRRIFADTSLSRSGRLSCASCHDPAHAFGPPNGLPVQRGGAAMDSRGTRAVPSLRYMTVGVPFTEHLVDDEDGHGDDNGPTGGLTWDGQAQSAHEQALIPLFARHEFGNASAAELARRVRGAAYATQFDAAFSGPGERVFDDPARVVAWVAASLETYEQAPEEFRPYSSKYDAYLRGRTTLTGQEARGLDLFERPDKGNCARCHPSRPLSGGALPGFTDSAYAALGIPRNAAIPANRDATRFDLGLCANGRAELHRHPEYCGMFKTPTLRNVAQRQVFFHNGAIHTLDDAVRFYAQRDTNPARWYPRDARGRVRKYDDLPAKYRGNVEVQAPFGGRPGAPPPLDDGEVRDIVAFLKTLDDGWTPPRLAAR
jgi:cytochrome c peroxidase